MSNITKNIAYGVATELSPISIVLTPEFTQVLSGQPVTFITQGSASYDGSAISFSWHLEVPVGSSLKRVEVSPDTTEARLFPDVNGIYKVSVTGTNESGAVASSNSYVAVTATQAPVNRVREEAPYIGDSISNFWKVLDNRDIIEFLWSEYVKVLSSDYRKAAELVLSKSIDTIQTGRSASNIVLKPELSLSGFTHQIKPIKSLCGTNSATTTVKNFLLHAIVVDAASVFLTDELGNIIEGLTAKSTLHIYDGDVNVAGQYDVLSTNSQLIALSSRTPIAGKTLQNSELFVFFQDSDIVALSPTSTITVGDVLLINDNKLFNTSKITTVLATSATDSTVDAGYARISKVALKNLSISAQVHRTIVVSFEPTEVGLTNKVYVPSSELGGHNKFISSVSKRTLSFVNKQSFIAQESMGSELIGATVAIDSSRHAGTTHRIVSYTYDAEQDAAVFTISPQLNIPSSSFNPTFVCKCRITRYNTLENILLNVGNTSSLILNVNYFTDYTGTSYASILVKDRCFLQNMVNLSWRVSTTIKTTSLTTSIDYVKEGVRYGDLLVLALSTSVTTATSSVHCTVVGAYSNYVAIEVTDDSIVNSTTGELLKPGVQDKVLNRIFNELLVPDSLPMPDGSYRFTSLAKEIKDRVTHTLTTLYGTLITAAKFDNRTTTPVNTVYVTNSTAGNAILRLGVVPTTIIRNTTFPIKVTDPVASIPNITEFVYPKVTSNIENSDQVAMLNQDGSVIRRDSPEIILNENVGFFIKNNTEFSGTMLQKEANSLVVSSDDGFFIDRGVDSGDVITIDSVDYVVKHVLSSSTLEILEENTTLIFESTALLNKQYVVRQRNSHAVPYIQFRPGIFSPSNPAPQELFAPTVIIDNVKQVENNFGRLVGYSIKEFYDFSAPQISYLNAIRGLMYVLTNGPTIKNIELATAILLNLPVTQNLVEILEIDMQNGRMIVQKVNPISLAKEDTPAYYHFSTKETVSPFNDIARNEITGEKFKIGDIIAAFTPLTNKVVVEDNIYSPFKYLTQFHTWKVSIDANSISSRDIPLLYKFYDMAKPIHTKPEIVLVLFLVSTVQVKASLEIEGAIKFYDDPGFGLELSHSFDSSNQSGQILRLADKGELSTRTLLLGRDLVVTSTTKVQSNRGGFLLNSPDDFTDDPGIGVQNDVKELDAYFPFEGKHFVRGRNLVRQGDILRIYSGINHGIYSVSSVVSDTELTIAPLNGYGIYTRIPEIDNTGSPPNYREPNGALFGIYRLVSDIIISNVVCASVGSSSATFTNASFNWDGVAVGDVLVKTSDHTVKHIILEVDYDSITEDAAVTLTTDTLPTAGQAYFIYRPALIPRESNSGSITAYDAADPRHVVHDLTDEYKIEVGDQFVTTAGTYPEKYAVVTKVQSGSFEVSEDLSLSTSTTFSIRKLGRPMSYENQVFGSERSAEDSSDSRLELLHGYDDVSVALTSVGAPATATALPNTNSGISIKEISGLSSLPEPCDKIYLYIANTNNLVFEGTVYYQNAASVVCFTEQDTIPSHGITYKIKIVRRSRA